MYLSDGDYGRDTAYFPTRVTADARDGWPVEADRYRLVVARACPWANRAIIVRRLLGLETAISMAITGPVHDDHSWNFVETTPGGRDPVLGIERLEDAYPARDPGYTKGVTVPALVDIPTGQVVVNDFAQLTLDLSTEWRAFHRAGAPDLYPQDRREIDAIVADVYADVNNGVSRCGFAGTQDAYDAAYERLFHRLDRLEARLARQRYLVGDTITEADVRLFTTLVRFDAVYHGHFKCNRQKLTEFPALWAYARDLFQTPGLGDTIDFGHIKRHYYCVHRDINPTGIVPAGPDLEGWLLPHDRDALGGRPFGDGSPPGPPPADEVVADSRSAEFDVTVLDR
jgi:putative glutathione S-transferase